jgi:hypothetical protein
MIVRRSLPLLALLGTLALGGAGTPPDSRGLHFGRAPVQSLGAMTFGPDGTLFIADVKGAALFAFDPGDAGTSSFGERVLAKDLDRRVASLLGTTADRIRFHDMAVAPKSHNVYLTVARQDGETEQPALVRVRGTKDLEVVDLERIKFATTPLPEAPARDTKTPWGQPQWTLAVTDLAFADGQLYVAGLSNEQFASALRRVPFPFGKTGAVNTVEIYHTSHDRWETAAPIEAFLPISIGGVPMIVAGYGCSPIATFRRADFAGTAHLKGRTVAELGGGNRPLDIIRYQKDGHEYLLIANSHRTLMKMDAEALGTAPEMTKPVNETFKPGGLSYLPVASAGVMHIDNLNDEYIAVLQRDLETGSVDLVAFPKKYL